MPPSPPPPAQSPGGSCPVGFAPSSSSCAACPLVASATASFGASLARSGSGSVFGASQPLGPACNSTGGLTFAWTLLDGQGRPAAADKARGPTLSISPRSLEAGGSASATLSVCYALEPLVCAVAPVAFEVVPAALSAVLSGGGGVVGEASVVRLDAARSLDPDGEPGALSFAWSCSAAAAQPCLRPDGSPLALEGVGNSSSAVELALRGSGGAGTLYTLSLAVSKGARVATVNTTVTVKSGALPLVALQGLAQPKLLASERLTLLGNVSSRHPASLRTVWSVTTTSAALNLSSPLVAATPLTSRSLVLLPGALQPGARYTFRLSASDLDGEAFAESKVAVAGAPSGGALSVSPQAGTALETQFQLAAAGWLSDDAPLLYAFSYQLAGSSEGSAPVALTPFQPSPTVNVTLPAGLAASGHQLQLFVTTMAAPTGATSASSRPATVQVTFRAFASPAEMNSYAANLADSAASALASGDPAAALQLVGGLAALLEVSSGPPPPPPPPPPPLAILRGVVAAPAPPPAPLSPEQLAAQRARISQRENLLSLIGNATSSVPQTPAAMAASVGLVANIVSSTPVAELSPAAQWTALDIVGACASSTVPLSPATQKGIANALSALGGAALAAVPKDIGKRSATVTASAGATTQRSSRLASTRTAQTAASCTVLERVVHVLEALTAGQLSGMSVPGEFPATLVTANIKSYAALDVPTSDARLFTVATTADGAGGSVHPLPSNALDAAKASSVDGFASTGVAVTFFELAFDPWDCGASNSTAVTRLALSSGGTEVAVNRLQDLVRFSLPVPPSVDYAEEVRCAWWNRALGEYSTEGCVALPNPAPPNTVLAFTGVPGAPLARAWSAAGPMFDNCSLVFLDCATARSGDAPVWPDPAPEPVVPGVSCLPGRTDTLRVYTGADCGAWQPGDGSGCYWNATEQAFAGNGCALQQRLQAAATHLTDFTAFHVPRQPLAWPVWPQAAGGGGNATEAVRRAEALQLWSRLRWLMAITGGAALSTVLTAAATHLLVDRPACAEALAMLTTKRLGFAKKLGGVWTWRLGVTTYGGAPSNGADDLGPLAELAALARVPVARLRCAIPEELIAGTLASVLGRKAALAAAEAAKAGAAKSAAAAPPARAPRISSLILRPAGLELPSRPLDGRQGRGSESLSPGGAPRDSTSSRRGPSIPRASMCPRPWRASSSREDAEAAASDADTLASTALVFALLAALRLVAPQELAKRRAAAAAFFVGAEEAAVDAGALGVFEFEDLVRKFTTLLAGASLRGQQDWLGAARLWRLALLQERDGSWDASAGLSFMLHATPPLCCPARAGAPAALSVSDPLSASPEALIEALPLPLLALRNRGVPPDDESPQLTQLRMAAAEAAAHVAQAAAATQAAVAMLATSRRDGLLALLHAAQSDNEEEPDTDPGRPASAASQTRGEALLALAAPQQAGAVSVPSPTPSQHMQALAAASLRISTYADNHFMSHLDVERIWATSLAVAAAQRFAFCYVPVPPCSSHPQGASVVDLGMAWLDGAAAADVRLAVVMPWVMQCACEAVGQWERAHRARVAPLRLRESASPAAAAKASRRRAATLWRALAEGVAPPSGGRPAAWQRVVSALTLGAVVLAIVLGMFSQRADACCAQLRAALRCDGADPLATCYGVPASECAQLEATLRGHAAPQGLLLGTGGLTCDAFPAPGSLYDKLFCALLVAAATMPLKLFLSAAWDRAAEAADPATQAAWVSRQRGDLARLLLGPNAPSVPDERAWRLTGASAPSAPARAAAAAMLWARSPVARALDVVVDAATDVAVLLGAARLRASKARAHAAKVHNPLLAGSTGLSEASLSLEATEHLMASAAANKRAATRATAAVSIGCVAALLTWAAIGYCVFAFGLRCYAQLGPGAEVQVGVLWLFGVAGSAGAEWALTLARTAGCLAATTLAELLLVRSDSAWLSAQLDWVASAGAACTLQDAKRKAVGRAVLLRKAKVLPLPDAYEPAGQLDAAPSRRWSLGRQSNRILPVDFDVDAMAQRKQQWMDGPNGEPPLRRTSLMRRDSGAHARTQSVDDPGSPQIRLRRKSSITLDVPPTDIK